MTFPTPFTPRQQKLLSDFAYHKPTDDQVERISNVRRALRNAAEIGMLNTEEGPDQTAAVRLVHEAMMTFNKAIVCETPENAEPIRSPAAGDGLRPLRTDGDGQGIR